MSGEAPILALLLRGPLDVIIGAVHPSGFEPMLATASRQLEGDGWAFEPKLDGWRALVHVEADSATVYSRPGRNVTESVPQLAALVDALPAGTVLDGEIVARSGRASSFYQLSPKLSTGAPRSPLLRSTCWR